MQNHNSLEDSLRKCANSAINHLSIGQMLVDLAKEGFVHIEHSGRYLIKHEESGRYFKLSGAKYDAENFNEVDYWSKIKTKHYRNLFTASMPVCTGVIEVEFAHGLKLSKFDRIIQYKIFSKIDRLTSRIYKDFGIVLYDIHNNNIMYNPLDKSWKIFDYGGSIYY